MENSESPASHRGMPSHPRFVPRRRHIKSRNGCLECKRRKVKCDERQGSCGACLKRGSRCSFKEPTPPPSLRPTPSPRPQLSDPIPVSSLLDLELLHNYSTKTCVTVTSHVSMHHFYQTAFITEALKCNYLLHCILGLSAFHLVQQYHEILQDAPPQDQPTIRAKIDKYLLAASFHHNAGLSLFRQDIADINENNCHNLFAAATVILLSSFAEFCDGVCSVTEARSPSDIHVPGLGLSVTNWLILLRGVKAVVADTWEWVRTGPMCPIITPRGLEGYETEIADVDGDSAFYLDRLAALFVESSEPDISRICIPALSLLRKSWAGIASGCDFGVAMFWGALVEDEFMALLEAKVPEALLVLGAYCVLLHTAEGRWWIKGWPKNMLRMIEGMVGAEWKSWLKWPAKVIGNEAGQWKDKFLVVTEGRCC